MARKLERPHLLRVRVVCVVGVAVAQAGASPRLDPQKVHDTDVGSVGFKVHESDVTRGTEREKAKSLTTAGGWVRCPGASES
jgi:hypothetical protein